MNNEQGRFLPRPSLFADGLRNQAWVLKNSVLGPIVCGVGEC